MRVVPALVPVDRHLPDTGLPGRVLGPPEPQALKQANGGLYRTVIGDAGRPKAVGRRFPPRIVTFGRPGDAVIPSRLAAPHLVLAAEQPREGAPELLRHEMSPLACPHASHAAAMSLTFPALWGGTGFSPVMARRAANQKSGRRRSSASKSGTAGCPSWMISW